MNCQKGDLAIVVAVPPDALRALGCVVTCVELIDWDGRDVWMVEPPAAGYYWGINDKWLRPLRDPGDDAVDETLLRLPAPREVAPA